MEILVNRTINSLISDRRREKAEHWITYSRDPATDHEELEHQVKVRSLAYTFVYHHFCLACNPIQSWNKERLEIRIEIA